MDADPRELPQTLRRSAFSTLRDTASPARSCVCQSALPDTCYGQHSRKPGTQGAFTRSSQPIRIATVVACEGLNESLSLQPGEGAIQRAWSQLHAGDGGDVLRHGVTVLFPFRQTDQDQQSGLGEPSEI